ncbi:hypothetical protein H072_8176 [Dactylellina haptotyla CBS 200.50]|uniref:Replication protein A OB domain-containing protein n=1 Tax=Dactylellina haptotyla (strain CBS 200.50) TaxID=1284197 RepID=S8A4Y2_DACHA|nr:hypothetical protein H072_8176 [Dactylellina haptotyla CBS 200.50]
MAARRRPTPHITMPPIIARVVSGQHGTHNPIREPLLRIAKVQGISMTAGPRDNLEDETVPQEGEVLYAYRLFLTDDVYMVSAVLDPVLHQLVHDKILTGPGTYIRLTDYDVRTSTKKANTRRFTRFLKVRALIVEYSPEIRFISEDVDQDGDSAMQGTEANSSRPSGSPCQYENDEVVVIKQEAASSQHQADIGLDGNRDREFDEYQLDIDDEEDLDHLLQVEHWGSQTSTDTFTATPDSYTTADERPASPDYLLDDLDDVTEDDIVQWLRASVEPKTHLGKDISTTSWKSVQKERFPEERLKSSQDMRDITTHGNSDCIPPTQNIDSRPIFHQKENVRKPGISTYCDGKPKATPARALPGITSQDFAPLPRQDRGLSPGPADTPRLPQSILAPARNTQPPMTPKKTSRQNTPLSPPISSFSTPLSPSRPIQLTKLGDLFKKPIGAKVDVLAVVARCDEQTISRSIGVKRDMHLLDPTVKNTVWLSVWVDAENFRPVVGSCVLFRGLTVHKFDGRSLNAFKELSASQWSFVEPSEDAISGVNEVKEWWRKRAVEETLRSFGDDED